MNSISMISSFLFLAIASVSAGGLPLASVYAPSPLLARSYFSSPLLAPQFLAASAPAFARAGLPLVARSAPLLAPATVGYAHSVPQNIPPYASQVNIVNRAISGYASAPLVSQYFAPSAAPALLRSPLAYPSVPAYSSLPYLRSPLPAPLALSAATPLAYSTGAFPLHTQAIFRSAFAPTINSIGVPAGIAPIGVPAGIAPIGVPTRIAPTVDGVQEISPLAEEDPADVATRTTMLEPVADSENPTEAPAESADEQPQPDNLNTAEQADTEEALSSN